MFKFVQCDVWWFIILVVYRLITHLNWSKMTSMLRNEIYWG